MNQTSKPNPAATGHPPRATKRGPNDGFIEVRIGETKASADPDAALIAYGVGSCVCVCAHDPALPAAGMAHILLPGNDFAVKGGDNDTRYADAAITELLRQMKELGASSARLTIKLAGGSNMFKSIPLDSANLAVRNTRKVRKILAERGLKAASEDLGGQHGRTISFAVSGGELLVSSAVAGRKKL